TIPERRRANSPRGARHSERGRASHRRERFPRGEGFAKKDRGNLMNADYPFQTSPRCSATSKRTKQPCMAPAVNGWTVCRFHGAGGGAPNGKRNGNYRHGLQSRKAV